MDYTEAHDGYAAQGIPRMDAEIVKRSHFWMETNYGAPGFPGCASDHISLIRTHSEGVGSFAFSRGTERRAPTICGFTQMLISSPRRKRQCHNSSSRPSPVKRGARRDPESPGFINLF